MITRRTAQQRYYLNSLLTLQSSPTSSNSNSSRSSALRPFTTTPPASSRQPEPPTTTPTQRAGIDPRWLSTIKTRIGKCLTFGLKGGEQVGAAAGILEEIARDWRGIVAGSEGFLTDGKRTGLFCRDVVWGDMDVMMSVIILTRYKGHVNNVNYVRYAETGRINWTRNFGLYIDPAHKKEWLSLMGSTGVGLILKSIKVDYKFPMTWPDKITVYHKLTHAPPTDSDSPRSPWDLSVLILSEARQRPAARCHEDLTTYDYRLGEKTATIPPFMLEQFRSTWKLQEEERAKWHGKVKEIERRVRELETGSWDRPDAVEDTGSAGG